MVIMIMGVVFIRDFRHVRMRFDTFDNMYSFITYTLYYYYYSSFLCCIDIQDHHLERVPELYFVIDLTRGTLLSTNVVYRGGV